MSKYINILEYKVFSSSMSECIDEIFNKEKTNVVSGNPEILYQGLHNESLKQSFMMESSVIIPDGVGTQISAKILKTPVKEKIAGIECMDEILKRCEKEGKGVYFLGAKEEVISLAVKNIKEKYKNLNVVGYRNGYFSEEEKEGVIENVVEANPYAIFVGLGCPRQENFILSIMDRVNTKIFMGVGGSFDVVSGTLKRAPKWMIALGLEWVYRVYNEPFRIKRLGSIPKFIWIVFKNRRKNSYEK
ncbi:MAG: WecB/TagA/CpsF family glycosyltransferase [Clostridium sp.]